MQTLGSMWRVVVIFALLSYPAQGSHQQARHLRASATPQTLAVESKEVQLAGKEAEEAVAQAEASGDTDDAALPSDTVFLMGEMASLTKEKADMPFGEYAPTCVNHLKKIARTMGDMYGDVQIRRVLKNECHADKQFPTAVDSGFDKYKDCLKFADRFPKAMRDERRGKNGFKIMCKQFFRVQDTQETAANVASAAEDAAKAALEDGKSPEEIAAAAGKAAYKAALAAGKSPEEARAMAAAAAAKVARDQARAAGKSKAEIEAAGRASRKAALKAVSEEQSNSASSKKSKKKSDKKKSKKKFDEDEDAMRNTTGNTAEERETIEEEMTADPRRSQESWWSWLNRKLFGGHPTHDSKDSSHEEESNVADEQLSTDDTNESLLDGMNASNGSKLDEDKRRKHDKKSDKEDEDKRKKQDKKDDKKQDEDMDAEDVVKEAEREESSMENSDGNTSVNVSAARNDSEDEDVASKGEQDELEVKEGQAEERQGGGGLFDWLFGSGEGKTYGAPQLKGTGKKSKKSDSEKSDSADADEDSSSKKTSRNRRHRDDSEETDSPDADEDSSSKKAGGHRRKRGHGHKKASADDSSSSSSAELAKGVTSQDLETLEDSVDEDASAATADDAYINSCVTHLRKVAKVIDTSYSDAQAEEALESQCNLDKEFGSVRHESFKRRKECKIFAKLFLKARLQELNGGKTGSYKKLCSWYYKYEDKAFD